MLAIINSSAVMGIEAYAVTIEVDATGGLPGFCMVGLPDSAVKEARERVFSAIKNSGYLVPNKRITVNLAPADIRKAGSAFDVPIALGILLASQQIEPYAIDKTIIIGELSLDGTVKPVKGILSIAMFARKSGKCALLLPEGNLQEAAVIREISVYPVASLNHLIGILKMPDPAPYTAGAEREAGNPAMVEHQDFADVKGQSQAKRACEIAASGAHNFLFIGSPGCGKSLIARRLPSILPPMSHEESLKTTMIHSCAGLLPECRGIISERPFRSPHHTISNMALVGGGVYPKPGEVSLAHNGVLFLDELPEFQKTVLEALRQPVEDGVVTIARSMITLSFPCRFMLGAAMNPCPCGFLLDPHKDCVCHPKEVKQYLSRISGPLLDRVDIQLEMPVLKYDELSRRQEGESSEVIRSRVEAARFIQLERFKDISGMFCNAHMETRQIRQYCRLESAAEKLFKDVIEKVGISARAYDRILRVARTVADLADSENIREEHIAEAVHYRSLDRTSRFFG